MSSYAYMAWKDDSLKEAFIKLGVDEKNIFEDVRDSGTVYQRMVRSLKKGDVVYIQSCRSRSSFAAYDNISATMSPTSEPFSSRPRLVSINGVFNTTTSAPLSFTKSRHRLRISCMLIPSVRQSVRQREGIERAKKKGVHCGRVARPLPANFDEACKMWKRGEITASEAARRCNMPVSTFRYHAGKN